MVHEYYWHVFDSLRVTSHDIDFNTTIYLYLPINWGIGRGLFANIVGMCLLIIMNILGHTIILTSRESTVLTPYYTCIIIEFLLLFSYISREL